MCLGAGNRACCAQLALSERLHIFDERFTISLAKIARAVFMALIAVALDDGAIFVPRFELGGPSVSRFRIDVTYFLSVEF